MKVSLLVILVTIYLQNSVTAQETICAYGYKFNGTACVASTDNSLTVQQPCNSCPNKCPAGYVFRNNQCWPTTCPDGSPVGLNGKCTSITTSQLICKDNFKLIDGQCVQTSYGTLVCEHGYTFQNGKCVSSHQERPICTSGKYDISLKRCTEIVPKQCPSGSSIASDGSCTRTETVNIICQPGYHIEGNRCVFKILPECNGGLWENGNCVTKINQTTIVKCPYGFTETNGECQKRVIPEHKCPLNSYYDVTVSQCKLIGHLTCPNEYSLRGSRCVKTQEVFEQAYCPPGYTNERDYCVQYSTAIQFCEIGILVNNYCVIIQPPVVTCPDEFTLDEFTKMCFKVIRRTMQCSFGATLDNGYCVTTVPPQCPPDSTPLGNGCTRIITVSAVCALPSVPSGDYCVIIDIRPPTCLTDYTFDIVIGYCVTYSVRPPFCEAGYVLENGECIKVVVVPPTCPDGYIYNSVLKICELIVIITPVPTVTPCGGTSCGTGCSKGGSGCTNTNTNTITISNIVNNNNTVSVPTNIHSTNINNISVPKSVEKTVEKPEVEKPIAEKCCTINTPRQCTQVSGRWNCEHKKYSRCGSFCRQSQMFLRPVETAYRHNMLVMPPPPRRLPWRNFEHLGK